MFGKHRQSVLKKAFQGWVKVWSETVVVRAAYKLRYSVIRQGQRINDFEKLHVSIYLVEYTLFLTFLSEIWKAYFC